MTQNRKITLVPIGIGIGLIVALGLLGILYATGSVSLSVRSVLCLALVGGAGASALFLIGIIIHGKQHVYIEHLDRSLNTQDGAES